MDEKSLSDPRQWLAVLIYFATLHFVFAVPLSVSSGLTLTVLVCWACNFGRQSIMNAGIGLLLLAVAVLAGWIPQPAAWSAQIVRLLHSS